MYTKLDVLNHVSIERMFLNMKRKTVKKHQAKLNIKAMLPLQYNASRSGYGVFFGFRFVAAARFFCFLLLLPFYALRRGYGRNLKVLCAVTFFLSVTFMLLLVLCTVTCILHFFLRSGNLKVLRRKSLSTEYDDFLLVTYIR
jgi:hypothetical protein